MTAPENFRPNSNYILLLKCVNAEPEGIVLTDKSRANTNFLEIVAVGPKCKLFHEEHIGRIVHVQNWSHYLMNMAGLIGDADAPQNEYWLCRETNAAGDPVIKPFIVDD